MSPPGMPGGMVLDGLLIPARALVNGTGIVEEQGLERVDYFHVELDRHDVLLAEGAASESFFEDGNRGQFHNAAEYAALYADAPAPRGRCAPWADCGFAVEAIWRRLAGLDQAESNPERAFTADTRWMATNATP